MFQVKDTVSFLQSWLIVTHTQHYPQTNSPPAPFINFILEDKKG